MHSDPRWAPRALLATALATCASSGLAGGDVVRWVNASGGAFDQGSNWDANHPPTYNDTAVFGPGAPYSVTLAVSPTTVARLAVDQGSPTIDAGGNRLNIGIVTPGPGDLSVGTAAAPAASLRFANGSLRIPVFGTVNLGTAPGTTGTLIIEPDATMTIGDCYVGAPGVGYWLIRGTAADEGLPDTGGNGIVHLNPGSTVRVEGGSLVARLMAHNGGRLEVVGGSMNMLVWSASGAGSSLFTGASVIRCGAPMQNSGRMTVSGGATVIPVSAQYSGDILVTGAGSTINCSSTIEGASTTLTVADGGSVHWPHGLHFTGTPRVAVGAGSALGNGDFQIDGGLLHVDQGATALFNLLTLPGPSTLEVAFDGASLPSAPMISCTAEASTLVGTLSVQVWHQNNLHIGDRFEVIRCDSGYHGSFSSLSAPVIGGGRDFLVEYSPTSVFLRVVSGGPACWTADFDGDGDVATDADIEMFFACLAGSCCSYCAPADFDGDGEMVDHDIEAFFRVLAGGAC